MDIVDSLRCCDPIPSLQTGRAPPGGSARRSHVVFPATRMGREPGVAWREIMLTAPFFPFPKPGALSPREGSRRCRVQAGHTTKKREKTMTKCQKTKSEIAARIAELNARQDKTGVEFIVHFPLKKVKGKYRIIRRAAYEPDTILEFNTLADMLERFTEN